MDRIHSTCPRSLSTLVVICAAFAVYVATMANVSTLLLAFFLIPLSLLFAWKLPAAVLALYVYIPFYKSGLDGVLPIDLTVLLALACTALSAWYFVTQADNLSFQMLGAWSVLLALVIVGTLYASSFDLALGKSMNFAFLVALPLTLAIHVGQSDKLKAQFLAATVVISATLTIFGLIGIFTGGGGSRLENLSNTIGTGRAALLLPIVLFVGSKLSNRAIGPITWFVVPLSFLVAVSAGSRGPLVAFVIAMVYTAMRNSGRVSARVLVFALATVPVGIVISSIESVQQYLPSAGFERISAFMQRLLGGGEVDSVRTNLLQAATDLFTERPLFGFGTGGFEQQVSSLSSFEDHSYPHNLVIHFASDWGIMGLTVLGVLVWLAILRPVPRAHDDPNSNAIAALFLFALISAMFSNDIYDNRWLWGMLVLQMTNVHLLRAKNAGAIAPATTRRPLFRPV